MIRVPVFACVLAAAALIATGCGGGGQTDKQRVEAVVTTYYRAFGSGDSNTACNQLATATVAALEKAGGKKCAQVLDAAQKRPDYARVAPKLNGVKVTAVKVTGKAATATTQVPGVATADGTGVTTTVPLRKEGGSWKIASTIGEG